MSNDGLNFSKVSGSAEFAQAALDTVGVARHQLSLMTVNLPQLVFGSEAFAEKLRTFVLGHRRASLRVLVHEPADAVRNSVRLAEFGRLLSSRIEFREVPATRRQLKEEYLIADEKAVLYRASTESLDAKFYAAAPMVARSHLRTFDAIWQEAQVAREFTALKI
ncbi:MAG TPA: hypothetical protein VJM11_17400 [Nevskiaceae bacterium]|nr:hypothetical protein [Nevskiaceae bacterium]